MKLSLLVPLLALLHGVPLIRAQSSSYLNAALDAAMELQKHYEEEVLFFRYQLTWQTDDMGYYLTVRIANALERATTEQQGRAIQKCAEDAAYYSHGLIERFDDSLRDLQDASTRIIQSVLEELIETNIKVDTDRFNDHHAERLERLRSELEDHHIVEVGDRWMEMWYAYFLVSENLDQCIEYAFQ